MNHFHPEAMRLRNVAYRTRMNGWQYAIASGPMSLESEKEAERAEILKRHRAAVASLHAMTGETCKCPACNN